MNPLHTQFYICLSIAVLSGCTQQPTDPVEVEEVLPIASAEKQSTEGPQEPSPSPAFPSTGAPWIKEGVDGQEKTDKFTFWGWSADGSKYAFEVVYSGAGAATCEGQYFGFWQLL